MIKVAIALIAAFSILTSCGQKSGEDTHTHDDGTVHADHDADTTQEEFNATDTTRHLHDSTTHEH
jgi:hypothetical protein